MHFVYTRGPGEDAGILGASMNIDREAADRIATYLAGLHGEEVTPQEVQAFTPQPVQDGDIVTGRTANALPRGTAIARVSRIDGVAVTPTSGLLRVRDGWVCGTDTADCPGERIHEEARYKVLLIGQPWDGPPSTARRR